MNTMQQKNKSKQIFRVILLGMAVVTVGVLFPITVSVIYTSPQSSGSLAVFFSAILSLLIATSTFIILKVPSDVRSSPSSRLAAIEDKISILENEKPSPLDRSDHDRLVDKLSLTLKSEAVDALIDGRITEVKKRYEQIWSSKQFHEPMNETRDRLLQQVDAFGGRANLNLGIGLLFSVAGAILLVYFVLNLLEAYSFTDFIIHFFPRISLILLIEVFSYFFLQLYKQGIGDIRYFQNEITNIESKYVAILLSQRAGNDKIDNLIDALAKTERNFTMSKDQRIVTEAIEAKIDTAMERLMTGLKNFIPKDRDKK
ncbi:MAG: hypothetical protein WBX25_02790 [Rhodomicrobium sp.]